MIDTPGFGDTCEDKNEENLQRIENLFKSETIISSNAICFVENYNSQRLTRYRKQVFDTMTNIFGSDIKENIYIVATFCVGFYDASNNIEPAPTLESLTKEGIRYNKCFPFNNKNIFKKPKDDFYKYWETSMTSFELFFEELDGTKEVSLHLSSKILEQQQIILHAKLPEFVRNLKDTIHEIDDHRQNLKAITNQMIHLEQGVTYMAKVEKQVMETITERNIFSVICTKCDGKFKVCHYPSTTSRDSQLWRCKVMSWFNTEFRIYCHVCKCPWTHHRSCRQRLVHQIVEETRTNEGLRQQYLQSRENEKESLIKSCEAKIVSAYSNLLKDLQGIQESIDSINNNCLSKHPTTIEKYVN